MPRTSQAARAMARFQVEASPPRPPGHLGARAKRLWAEITRDRPPGFFRPGATELLATFVQTTVTLDALWPQLRKFRDDQAAVGRLTRRICALASSQVSLATHLRLTPRATIERHAAMRDAPGIWNDDPLFAGKAAALKDRLDS
jgi:hypothetical protein